MDSTGRMPTGALLHVSNGKYYGVTTAGGLYHKGVIFSFDPINNIYIDEFDFAYPQPGIINPSGGLIQASDGLLYGMTQYGGPIYFNGGTIYSFDINQGVFTFLYNFLGPGGQPGGKLVEGENGDFYGMTAADGALFKYNTLTNTYTDLYDFVDTITGGTPWGSLIKAANGKLYGMTSSSSVNSHATIFNYDIPTDSLSILSYFNSPTGTGTFGSLVEASNGEFYGMTRDGGAFTNGVVFSLDTFNVYTDLVDFDGINGRASKQNLIQASDGKLYGMTELGGIHGYGAIFNYNINTNTYNKILTLIQQPEFIHGAI